MTDVSKDALLRTLDSALYWMGFTPTTAERQTLFDAARREVEAVRAALAGASGGPLSSDFLDQIRAILARGDSLTHHEASELLDAHDSLTAAYHVTESLHGVSVEEPAPGLFMAPKPEGFDHLELRLARWAVGEEDAPEIDDVARAIFEKANPGKLYDASVSKADWRVVAHRMDVQQLLLWLGVRVTSSGKGKAAP